MTETIKRKLSDSSAARWTAMLIVSFTMMCGYFITDVMSPLGDMLTRSVVDGGMGWTPTEYGWFSGAYSWLNIFLLMLLFGGIILDKMGVRFTGVMACGLMVGGALLKAYAVSPLFPEGGMLFGFKTQMWMAGLGFAIFGMGAEICGITVSATNWRWRSVCRWPWRVWERPPHSFSAPASPRHGVESPIPYFSARWRSASGCWPIWSTA